MRRLLTFLVLALVSGAAPGCSSTGRAARPGSEPVTTLEVDNQNFTDMTIYLVNGGQRIRIGRATGKTKAVLRLPRRSVTSARELQFLAQPAGTGGAITTRRIWVEPGDRVTLLISP